MKKGLTNSSPEHFEYPIIMIGVIQRARFFVIKPDNTKVNKESAAWSIRHGYSVLKVISNAFLRNGLSVNNIGSANNKYDNANNNVFKIVDKKLRNNSIFVSSAPFDKYYE